MLTTSRMIGTGSGMTSPKRPPRATKSATVSVVEEEVEGVVGDVGLGEAGGEEGGGPDRHLPGVDEDGDHVRGDADRGDLEARHPPVAPQPDEDQAVGDDVGPADRDVRADAGLGGSARRRAGGASARRRSHDQRSLSSARRGIPPPASAPTMSARRMVLRNIVRGQGRSGLLRRRGHVSWDGWMEHRRQLVGAVGRPVEDGRDPGRRGSARSRGRTGCR